MASFNDAEMVGTRLKDVRKELLGIATEIGKEPLYKL